VYNMLEGDVARSYWELSTRLEIKPTLGPDRAPIRNPYREVMSIAYGFFSLLEGVMTWNVVEPVLRERRLLSGWLFPFPRFRRRWGLCGGWGAGFGAGRGAGGFAFCRGYAVTCGRL